MAPSPFGLPPVPPELKSILPFLQRADEMKQQDPIISYWCAYYAAQLGIRLKARDNPSRDLLFALLGVLEKTKTDISPNDAIDIESVSSAYVEHFALKVFANADNEDRNGHATRSTAKKFHAAATFLQVLSTFPKTDISESTEEKIRYAKWKAADIAKAYREGRKPAPGPPGWAEEQDELKRLDIEQEVTFNHSAPEAEISSPTFASQVHFSGNHLDNSFSNPAVGFTDPPTSSWSTAEAHGLHASGAIFPPVGNGLPSTQDTKDDLIQTLGRSGTGAHTIDAFSGSARGPLKKAAWTNEELEGKYTPPKKSSLKSGSPDSDRRVHFSPTTTLEPSSPVKSPSEVYSGPESIYAPPSPVVNHVYSPVPPPPPANTPGSYIYAPPPRDSPPRAAYPSTHLPKPFELTPEIVSKAQKLCRYAISALDYEDTETARKELREALALLEG